MLLFRKRPTSSARKAWKKAVCFCGRRPFIAQMNGTIPLRYMRRLRTDRHGHAKQMHLGYKCILAVIDHDAASFLTLMLEIHSTGAL